MQLYFRVRNAPRCKHICRKSCRIDLHICEFILFFRKLFNKLSRCCAIVIVLFAITIDDFKNVSYILTRFNSSFSFVMFFNTSFAFINMIFFVDVFVVVSFFFDVFFVIVFVVVFVVVIVSPFQLNKIKKYVSRYAYIIHAYAL